MSILIAYMIIGFTFAVSVLLAHVPTNDDRWWHYTLLLLIVILWPLGIHESSKTDYRRKIC